MNTRDTGNPTPSVAKSQTHLTGQHHRTLDAIFRHPSAHNLEWNDVVELIGEIGDLHEQANNKFVFEIAGHRHIAHKPHTKDLTSSETIDLRHFLLEAGVSPAAQHLPDSPAL